MGFKRHILDVAAGRRIDHCQSSLAVADDDASGRRVDPDIVSIAAKLDLPRGLVSIAFEQLDRTIPRIGDEQYVGRSFSPVMVRTRL
jgi:hypothetical protein